MQIKVTMTTVNHSPNQILPVVGLSDTDEVKRGRKRVDPWWQNKENDFPADILIIIKH